MQPVGESTEVPHHAGADLFDARVIGFLGIKINGEALLRRDPGDLHQGTGWFADNQLFWEAPAGVTTATVTFEALFASGMAGTMGVDSVIFFVAT